MSGPDAVAREGAPLGQLCVGDYVVVSVEDRIAAVSRGHVVDVGEGWVEVDLQKPVRVELLPTSSWVTPWGLAPSGPRPAIAGSCVADPRVAV